MIDYTQAIQKLYVAYFSRPADVAGLNYWQGVVSAANGNTAEVSAAFAGSAEYKAAYANKTASQIVDTVYFNLFGRHAEQAGLDFWGPLLDNGSLTIDLIVTAVAGGARSADLIAYNCKVSAATAFTVALDKAAEIAGYEGASAVAKAIAFLAAVTDNSSLAAATGALSLNATIAAVTGAKPDAVAPAPPSIALTTGLDAPKGTAGDDLFTAGPTTLTLGDLISGGAGFDTLTYADKVSAPDAVIEMPGELVVLSSIEQVNILTSGSMFVDATSWRGISGLILGAHGTGMVGMQVPKSARVGVIGPSFSSVEVYGGSGFLTVDNVGPAPSNVSGQGSSMTGAWLGSFDGMAHYKGAGMRFIGLMDITMPTTVTISNDNPGHSLLIQTDKVGFASASSTTPIDVTVVDALAGSVTVNAVGTYSALNLSLASATKLTLAGSQWLYLDTKPEISTKLAVIDGSTATGDLKLKDFGASVHTVATGSGHDVLTMTTLTARDNLATPGVTEAVTATVSTGYGDDLIYLATTGNGLVNVAAGDGKDEVIVESRSGSETLNIDLGTGADFFWSFTDTVRAGDTIKGGEGSDALDLKFVSASNMGAFSGFEKYNAAELDRTLDINGLMAKNASETIYTHGYVGNAHLMGVPAGTELVVLGDMAGSTLAVTLASTASQRIRVDLGETDPADVSPEFDTASISLTNAAFVSVLFESAYRPSVAGEPMASDNTSVFNLSTKSTVEALLHSGGVNASNVLNYTDLSGSLRALAVTGSQKMALSVIGATLDTINGAAHIGGLTVSTGSLADTGTIKLGTGADVINVAASSTAAGFENVANMERASAAAIGADALAADIAIRDSDILVFGGASVANATSVAGGSVNSRGVLTFTGAAPDSIAAAFAIASLAAESSNELLVFGYQNDSYVFLQGDTDIVVKLVGTTGVNGIAENGSDGFFIL